MGVVHNPGQEFWQPPAVSQVQTQEHSSRMVEVCDRCGTEFVVGARYCHVCGETRGAHVRSSSGPSRYLRPVGDFLLGIKRGLGLGTASLLAFAAALACVLAAVFTGVVYTATTVLDWQAVQVWRLEWLLAAAVALLAGILLKKSQQS